MSDPAAVPPDTAPVSGRAGAARAEQILLLQEKFTTGNRHPKAMQRMYVKEARLILARPIFGDELCIWAAKLLLLLECIAEIGDPPCPCCDGDGDITCGECGEGHDLEGPLVGRSQHHVGRRAVEVGSQFEAEIVWMDERPLAAGGLMALSVLHSWRNLAPEVRGAAVAFGSFDGLHLGHREVIAAGTPAERVHFELFPGTHRGLTWRYPLSLSFLVGRLSITL